MIKHRQDPLLGARKVSTTAEDLSRTVWADEAFGLIGVEQEPDWHPEGDVYIPLFEPEPEV